MNDADTVDISWFNLDDYITDGPLINVNNGSGMNDSKTTTNTSNLSSEPAKSLQDKILEPIIAVKDKAAEAVTSAANAFKIPIMAFTIAGFFIGSYFLLSIFANVKRNVKAVKSK